ncbi:hypothetical protein EVAR_20405_1 [Eumeta japonica]|uniref:Uncharacterized protein n=1 Tax=Eumeta variegata TaxID=151549 RepID=A0A4C1TYD7_EUMVA|nr:hypothetical protein EVAR_20405_1 [Eumeta japonica]
MSDFQGLMMEPEGSDDEASKLPALLSDPESQSWSKCFPREYQQVQTWLALSRGERAYKPPEYRWSPPPMDTRDYGKVTRIDQKYSPTITKGGTVAALRKECAFRRTAWTFAGETAGGSLLPTAVSEFKRTDPKPSCWPSVGWVLLTPTAFTLAKTDALTVVRGVHRKNRISLEISNTSRAGDSRSV